MTATKRFASRSLALAMALLVAAASSSASSTAAALRCSVAAPPHAVAGQPVLLRFTLTNTGTAALQLLRWNTPFENGWFAPFVAVTRDGVALPWQGPSLKRGDPDSSALYLRLEAGASHSAELDLALPVDLSRPGRIRVEPRIRLVDVLVAESDTVPRPRARHTGYPLACAAIEFSLAAPADLPPRP